MNIRIIAYVVGLALNIEALLFALPLVTAVIYGDSLVPFIVPAVICLAIGIPFTRKKPKIGSLYSKEGFVSTGITWIAMSLTGMLPFIIDGAIPSVFDAFFETVSGFTTTGASILTDVEALSHSLLMWRSQMHWIGGMGILVFMLAMVPLSGGTQMNLMKAESPGPSISKLVPKAQDTARILYGIYAFMTVLTGVILVILKMPLFDAICISFGAAGTGGFSVLNSGCASYTTAQQIVITIAMIAFGVNFQFYYLLLLKRFSIAFSMEEVKTYFMIIAGSIVLITLNLTYHNVYDSVGRAIHDASFHVGSIITTTGFATTDVNIWPNLSQGILVLLMFCGACAGSTGGGLKVSRAILLFKSYVREARAILHPGIIKKVHMDGKVIDEGVIRATGAYFFIYMVIIAVSILLISLDHLDWPTTFTSVIATFNNIGPGLGGVGTVGNYSEFSNFSKLILSGCMLIGRLEIFPIMLLFMKKTWTKF